MRYGRPLIDRVVEKIEISESGCWLWTAAKNRKGYGVVNIDNATQLAHRVVYKLAVGPFPEGLHSDHLCRTPACVNPDHVEPVTRLENARRGTNWQTLKTHCPQGHEYTPENTKRGSKDERVCITCNREHQRAYKQRLRERVAA